MELLARAQNYQVELGSRGIIPIVFGEVVSLVLSFAPKVEIEAKATR